MREIEKIFRSGVEESQSQVKYLSQLVVALRQELEQPALIKPLAAAKRCLWQRFAAIKPQLLIIDIDNDAQHQELIKEATVFGIEASVATNLTSVRETTAQKRPDVVLLTLHPNSMEISLELLAELSTNNWALPVLVYTPVEDFDTRLKVARLGATVFLRKPILPASILAAVMQVLQLVEIAHAKIMVVDDDPQMLDILRTLLEPWGFDLALLNNPQHFWDRLNTFNPDLLILDVEMPLSNINGIELCQVVRNDPYWNQLPVLFLSIGKNVETINRVFMAGGDDYVTKPILEPELIARILNRLERTIIYTNNWNTN